MGCNTYLTIKDGVARGYISADVDVRLAEEPDDLLGTVVRMMLDDLEEGIGAGLNLVPSEAQVEIAVTVHVPLVDEIPQA